MSLLDRKRPPRPSNKGMSPPVLNEKEHVFTDSAGKKLAGIHSKDKCKDRTHCPIHHPSDHHMKDWPLVWGKSKKIFYRRCPHGKYHPDPDSVKFWILSGKDIDSLGHSGQNCDGCCNP